MIGVWVFPSWVVMVVMMVVLVVEELSFEIASSLASYLWVTAILPHLEKVTMWG